MVELASRRPAEKIDGPVLDVLRLGVHQLLSLRTAAHAVIDESVQLVRIARKASAAGFVNGVLRTVARDDADTWRERSLA
ncbi:transcription antitermination protein NusB, partial [Schumannella sp. 10F1B-5-1]|uniref:transcription antitermination protein NusB n=1 Tax=Schumannella sp. 10F1B-5-1 TaxID=2590780 RepID=UPI002106DB4A